MTIQIRALSGDDELYSIYPFIKQLNPKMSEVDFRRIIDGMRRSDYHCLEALINGKRVGICGYWIEYKFYSDKAIRPDHLVIDDDYRNQGIGRALLSEIEAIGQREGCNLSVFDVYAENRNAQRLYFREGYTILGYHFSKDL